MIKLNGFYNFIDHPVPSKKHSKTFSVDKIKTKLLETFL